MNELDPMTAHERHLLATDPEGFVRQARFKEITAEDRARICRGEVDRLELAPKYLGRKSWA